MAKRPKVKQPLHAKICGAKTRKGTLCRNAPMKNGRCRMHGGKSTGAPGNLNALKTGRYQTVFHDCLDEDEKCLWDGIDVDGLSQINDEIKLWTMRERRMLQRIQVLKQSDFTIVEKTYETSTGEDGVQHGKQSEKHAATLGQIQAIESDLTSVQAKKARAIQIREEIISRAGGDHPDVSGFSEAWSGVSDDELWEDHENG